MAPWWQNAVFYQVYPRSFHDANGDGVGDLPGLLARLNHFTMLGVDALWISPVFRSPMADFGYDVSDYTAIDPLFGTLADFDALLAAAHARGLRIVLDLVPNHTSDQHAWFVESRSSRDNPHRDWYIWRDPAPDGGPPNNWLSYFGGPAWTLDPASGQYYLHNFAPEQPELNYRNPAVKQAMFAQIRFWLDRGVDGFRIDVIDRMLKHPDLPDNPPDPNWREGDNPVWRLRRVHSENADGIHALIAEMGDVFRAYPDRVSIGEIAYSTDPAFIASFRGTPERPEIDMPFNFAPLMLPWSAEAVRAFVDAYDAAVPGPGANYVIGNHDQDRVATRRGPEQARVAAMLLLTLRGAAFIYQGEELGLTNGEVAREHFRDPQGINTGFSRDPCRTPFHWDDSHNAGFSECDTPWLPVAANYRTHNVLAELDDSRSFLQLYRQLIALRRAEPALAEGRYRSVDAPEGVFLYAREHDHQRLWMALNFTAQPQTVALHDADAQVVLSTLLDRAGETAGGLLTLRPGEGVIVRARPAGA